MKHVLLFTPPRSEFQKVSDDSKGFDRYWKELIPEGLWKHPTRGFQMNVTKDRMEGWVKNYNEAQKPRGIKIPVPYGHTYGPDKNAGFGDKFAVKQREDGKYALFGEIEVPRGEDAGKIGATVKDVSVSINQNTLHSNENGEVEELGECLEHVALTNYPVITGMSDFVALDKENEPHVGIGFSYEKDEFAEAETSEEQILQFAKELAEKGPIQLTVNVPVPQEVVEGERKASHEESNYRSGQEGLYCGKCLFFLNRPYNPDERSTIEGDCVYVEKPIKRVDLCDYFQSQFEFDQNSGEEDMTEEQLRQLEKKFSLEDNSLTQENWFDKINELQLDKYGDDKDGKEGGKKKDPPAEPAKLSQDPSKETPKPEENTAPPEPPKFDITKDPNFVAAQKETEDLKAVNHKLVLDLNRRKLGDVSRRLKNCLETGRLNKAAYDKIVPKQESLQFSQETSHGAEWDAWLAGIEAQLSIIEELPEGKAVPQGRVTSDSVPSQLDQFSQNQEEEEKKIEEAASNRVKEFFSDYHPDNVAQDPNTGLFYSKR